MTSPRSFDCVRKVGMWCEETLGCVGWFGFTVDNLRRYFEL
jgi:hypothetical protein